MEYNYVLLKLQKLIKRMPTLPVQPVAAKRKARSISSFLKKTYQILQDSHNSYAIRWAQTGIGFIVVKEQQFSKDILPQYFKHSNYSSFVRQLNMYNFHKIREANCQSHFHHQFFRKSNKELLSEIKRKPEKKKRKNQDQSDDERRDQQIDQFNEKSDVSVKQSLAPKQKHAQSQVRIKSYKSTPDKAHKNTHHVFGSQKENHGCVQNEQEAENEHFSSTFSYNKVHLRCPQELNESKQRVSIQNILVGSGQIEDDKLSINNQIADGFPRYPTKEIFCPSNNNIYPFPITFKGSNVISQFNILF